LILVLGPVPDRIIFMALLAFGFDAHAEDQFRILDGKQIKTRVVGQDITDGPHWSMYLRPDGALIGEESGSSWTGSWTISNTALHEDAGQHIRRLQ